MSIGIMDGDMATYLLVPFNLEAMKISAYYKNRGEIVIFAPTFFPERHRKFYYRKDYEDGIYPHNLAQPNVKYGGLAFSNNKYTPLPMEMERMKPDTELYQRMSNKIESQPNGHKIFQNLMTAEHCRLSLDGENIWKDYGIQFKNLKVARNLIFHDYDLGQVKNSFKEVKAILMRARTDGWATRIGMKFPVNVDSGDSLINWSSLKTNSTFYSLRYNGIIPDDAFIEWVGMCREHAVYKQMEYYVTPSWYGENDFIINKLPQIFRQVIISRSYHVFFTLKYDEGFFTDRRWEAVLQLFNYYMNSMSNLALPDYLRAIPTDTLYDFAVAAGNAELWRYNGDYYTQDQMRQIFAFVREKNYPLFKEFYECTAEKLGGKLN